MSGLRVGVDLVSIQRIQRILIEVGEPFLRRTWTAQEQADCSGRAESLAARWAAKEAVLKALGVGVGHIALTDIAVWVDDRGAPGIELAGEAAAEAERQGLLHWSVSLSHEGDFAIAVVAAQWQH